MFGQGGIWRGSDLGQQGRFIRWSDTTMPSWSWPCGLGAGLALLGAPTLDGADPNTEEAGRLSLREPGGDGSQQPLAEVGGVLLHPEIVALARLFRNPL